jgi:DNA polymerase I
VTRRRLYNSIRITNRPAPEQVARIDNGITQVLARMMHTGVCVDRDALSDLEHHLTQQYALTENKLADLVGSRVTITSHPQVRHLLFRQLKVQNAVRRKMKLTASGVESTGRLEIEPYLSVHPAVGLILEGRMYDKLRGTYCVPMRTKAVRHADGCWRVHTTLKPFSTDTGRLASEDPNLQNIPQRRELGRMLKACLIASPHCRMFEVDFSQIEMRVAAHEAGIKFMSDVFKAGGDIHRRTAMAAYKLPEDQIDEMRHRYPMKRAGFLILYMGTGAGLMVQLNSAEAQDPDHPYMWTEAECDALIEQWYEPNHEMREWQEAQGRRMLHYGMTWTLFGRVRTVPEYRSVHSWIRRRGVRQTANMPIQGGAADLFKMALAEIGDAYEELRDGGMNRCEALVPVHDAVLGEADEDAAEDVARLTKDIMENVCELDVPIKADVKIGTRWGALEKLKEAA